MLETKCKQNAIGALQSKIHHQKSVHRKFVSWKVENSVYRKFVYRKVEKYVYRKFVYRKVEHLGWTSRRRNYDSKTVCRLYKWLYKTRVLPPHPDNTKSGTFRKKGFLLKLCLFYCLLFFCPFFLWLFEGKRVIKWAFFG